MKISRFFALILIFVLLSSSAVSAAKLPNSIWKPMNNYTAAVNSADQNGIYNYGMEMIRIMEPEPESQIKTEFLAGKYFQVADAAEKLGYYSSAVELYTKYIPYGNLMNQADGVIFAQRKTKLLKSRLEIFYEAPVTAEAPYYTGARLEPSNGVLFGSLYEYEGGIESYDHSLIEKIYGKHPSLNLVYMEFGEDPSQLGRYTTYFNEIKNSGGAVMFAWNTSSSLADIENYANYIYNTVKWLDSWDIDIIVRFGAEMNVGTNGNDPEAYKKSFRYVADIVHSNTDMAVCWSPNDIGALDRPFENYYPGDEYVDWVGVSHYICRHFQGINNPDKNQQEISDTYFYSSDCSDPVLKLSEIVDFMERNNIRKPLAISECGAPHLTNYNERIDSWGSCYLYKIYGELIRMYPQIKAICYFNVERVQESQHYALYASPEIQDAYINSTTHEEMYIKSPDEPCNYVFSRNLPLTTSDNFLNISASAYYPHTENGIVVYSVDGVWAHQTSVSPYKFTLDLTNLTEGAHTLTVKYCSAYGEELVSKNHTFTLSKTIKVTVDGREVNFTDCVPFVKEGRTLVPLRAIFETLGASVGWDDGTQTVTATRKDVTVMFRIGDTTLIKNGVSSQLDVPAQLFESRTVVPVRAIAESFGCKVDWNGNTNTVIITTN